MEVPAFSPNGTTLSLLTPDAPPGTGTTKSALPAPRTGSRMLTVSAFPFLINAQLMLQMETVLHALKDTTSSTVNVFSPNQTTPSPPTLDAELGTGTTRSALLAQEDGSLMLTKFVFPSLTNAENTPKMVTALLATRDTTSLKENASSLNPTTCNPLTSDVPPGIGTIKSASLAPRTGSRMLTVSVFPSPINAPLTPKTVTAAHASKDTTSSVELVSSPNQTTPSLLTLDAELGTGTTRSALLAQEDGSSTLKTSVFPSLTNAKNTLLMVTALFATKVMTLSTDNASSLNPTTPDLPTSDAESGTGMPKNV